MNSCSATVSERAPYLGGDVHCATAYRDLKQARQFLEVMADGEPVVFQTFDDNGLLKDQSLASILRGDLDECGQRLQDLNARGAGIFWMVNYGHGRKSEDVTDIRALFLDLDGAPIEPVLAAGVKPHAVVESSPGKWHVYWLVFGCALPQFKPAQQALAAKFGGDPSVCDLPRVLRVPGFLHRKGEPFATRIESLVQMRPYAFGDLLLRLGLDLAALVRPPKPELRTEPVIDASGGRVTHPGRHNHLVKWAAQLNWRGIPAEALRVAVHAENQRVCEPPKTAAEVDAVVNDVIKRYHAQHGRDLGQHGDGPKAAAGNESHEGTRQEPVVGPPLFAVVPVADLAHVRPAAPIYWWDGYIPAGVVTLLGAHGGTGKSTVALMMAVCIALGLPLWGVPTRRGKVALFSGEDGAELMRHRLRTICDSLRADAVELAERLHILDATAGDPTLFHEVSAGGKRFGQTTPSYAELRAYIDKQCIDVLIVDNASDTFDASEIDRARVRGFMRALAGIAQARGGAVLLLAHIDKGTARKERSGSEGYSGSTAWHNSARSRLFLSREDGGTLLLEHQKHNLGKMVAPLRLIWPDGDVPQVDQCVVSGVQHTADGTDTKVLLKLVHQFYLRNEFIATDPRSRYHAVKVLGDEPTYPKRRKPAEVFRVLRDAEQDGLIQRETYKDRNRKERERWGLTPAGLELISAAPSAPCEPCSENGAVDHSAHHSSPSAPCGARGVRGRARAQDACPAPE